jgi:hypothetical protein
MDTSSLTDSEEALLGRADMKRSRLRMWHEGLLLLVFIDSALPVQMALALPIEPPSLLKHDPATLDWLNTSLLIYQAAVV